MAVKHISVLLTLLLSTPVFADMTLQDVNRWDKDVIELATDRVKELQLSCGLKDPAQAKVDILEEIYVRAEQAKQVPDQALLNNNVELYNELVSRSLILPIQYYKLYIILSGFSCEPPGVLVKKFQCV